MARTIRYSEPTQKLLRELIYMISQLEAYPLTSAQVPRAVALLERCNQINGQELQLLRAEITAQAHVDRIDSDLDPVIEDLSALLLRLLAGDRKAQLYQFFFGKRRPFELVRPVLGDEVEEVRGWAEALKSSEHEQLHPIGERIEALIAEADRATEERAAVDRQWNEFFMIGARKSFVDDLNALRRDLHADLSKLPQTPEGKGLPHDFADRFFLRSRRRQTEKAPPSMEEIRLQIGDLQALLEQREQEQREREEASLKAQTDRAELTALEQRAAELRAKLGL